MNANWVEAKHKPNSQLTTPINAAHAANKLFVYNNFSRHEVIYQVVEKFTNHQFFKLMWTNYCQQLANLKITPLLTPAVSYSNDYTQIHSRAVHYLTRLNEAAWIDLVLNQYSLFTHENNIHDVIHPTKVKLVARTNFHNLEFVLNTYCQFTKLRWQINKQLNYYFMHHQQQCLEQLRLLKVLLLKKEQRWDQLVQQVLTGGGWA